MNERVITIVYGCEKARKMGESISFVNTQTMTEKQKRDSSD